MLFTKITDNKRNIFSSEYSLSHIAKLTQNTDKGVCKLTNSSNSIIITHVNKESQHQGNFFLSGTSELWQVNGLTPQTIVIDIATMAGKFQELQDKNCTELSFHINKNNACVIKGYNDKKKTPVNFKIRLLEKLNNAGKPKPSDELIIGINDLIYAFQTVFPYDKEIRIEYGLNDTAINMVFLHSLYDEKRSLARKTIGIIARRK